MTHEMAVMGVKGDTKTIWDPDKPDEVASARRTFDDLKAKGYTAFSVKKDGDKGEIIQEFDASLGKIILVPRLAGGRSWLLHHVST